MGKIWKIKGEVSAEFKTKFPELNPLILQLLYNRNVTEEKQVEQFLNPDYENDTHDPFLFKEMKKAVKRIYQAIEQGEQITIHGDYDADGVCASAIIVSTLKDLGANVNVYLPHREKEGYGVNKQTIEHLAKNGTKLIITVDCGTANIEPIELAQERGIDVIITDHHHVPEVIPKSFAFINPLNPKDKYPFGYLCGAGVSFKLAQALFITDQKSKKPKLAEGYDKWLLDLVAIATVADMMPLSDENRVLVKYGLIVVGKTRRLGLQKLLERSGIYKDGKREITPFDVGFIIGPRINAAGRMDHANTAYGLMMATSDEGAEPLVEDVERNNSDRKNSTDKIVAEVLEQSGEFADKFLLFAQGQGWPIGLAGLVASKVMQKTGKPTIIMTKLPDRIAASGRSIPGFDMAKALEKIGHYFSTAGGHAMACGFSLKQGVDPEEVKKDFEKLARESLEGRDLRPELNVDAQITTDQITWKTYDLITQLRPFGKENEEPVFVTTDLTVEQVVTVGEKDQHLKLKVQDKKLLKSLSVIGFGLGAYNEKLKPGSKVDLAYKLDANEWNGNRELQLKLEDLRILDNDTIL